MENIANPNLDVKDVFMKCGTCSQTFAHLLNREFGNPDENIEHALNPLAGGIANRGHQCGMLWGAAMAIGAEAYHRYPDKEQALAISVTATQQVVESFIKRSNTVNCKEIIGYNLNSVFGMVGFMIKTMSRGMKNSQCFNLAADWAPEAIQAGSKGLENDSIEIEGESFSCASEVIKKMGGTDKEAQLVSGFAGGLGLSGKACGALSAAIWYQTLQWCKNNPEKNPPMFKNPIAKDYISTFEKETNSCFNCEKITGYRFNDINEHSNFINEGGCNTLINLLAKSPS